MSEFGASVPADILHDWADRQISSVAALRATTSGEPDPADTRRTPSEVKEGATGDRSRPPFEPAPRLEVQR